MKTTALTPLAQRQRKALLLLPLIIIPFIALLFWALGGGKGNAAKAQPNSGLNFRLPGALLDSAKHADKLAFYDQAQKDSVARVKERKQDPYAKAAIDSSKRTTASPAANEAKIYQQLATLQEAVNKPVPPAPVPASNYEVPVKQVAKTQATEDPEMKQMNQLLEKVMDIQHPERLKDKSATLTPPEQKFAAMPAMVVGNQKVVSGTVVKLKLLDSAVISGQTIPKGTLIYGAGNLYNQRLTITIKNIGLGNTILPVNLTVFDKNDALEGISVPEAVTGDALKDGTDQGVQGMELMSLDESMGAQAATAGINTAKSLFSKKIRRVKGKIKDGHLVLLRNNELKTSTK